MSFMGWSGEESHYKHCRKEALPRAHMNLAGLSEGLDVGVVRRERQAQVSLKLRAHGPELAADFKNPCACGEVCGSLPLETAAPVLVSPLWA